MMLYHWHFQIVLLLVAVLIGGDGTSRISAFSLVAPFYATTTSSTTTTTTTRLHSVASRSNDVTTVEEEETVSQQQQQQQTTIEEIEDEVATDVVVTTTTKPKPPSVPPPPSQQKQQKEQHQQQQDQRHRRRRRILGSQENLMLPRQYIPGNKKFPQMNHVCTCVLSCTPSEQTVQQALDNVIQCHPLLYCYVDGDGEPNKRIDLFQMVRQGEPNPCTFVINDSTGSTSSSTSNNHDNNKNIISSKDVLSIIDVLETDDRIALDASWKTTFLKDIDDGSWCNIEKGPLWKVEWHRCCSTDDDAEEDNNNNDNDNTATNKPCAFVFSFNHAISDQGSVNRMIDQLVSNIASIEEYGSIVKPTIVQKQLPVSVEDSVLGLNQRWNDVLLHGIEFGTIQYIINKATEGFKSPVILPDSVKDANNNNMLSSLSIISGKAAGGEDIVGSETRKTTLQFRTLSAKTTLALLLKCREYGVSVTNALTAAMTLTATDFIDGSSSSSSNDDDEQQQQYKQRNYKILQSLDLRRYGAQLDKGETVGCLAGSMDLIHGPILDHSGGALRKHPTSDALNSFWELARNGLEQTKTFISSNGPKHAMRVFDFAMTVSDLNNLVYLTAQSKDSQGRAYSAGVTNNGVYERQEAFQREGETERSLLKSKHGRYNIDDIYYAVSHARSGCLYQLSCLTLGEEMKLTFHPAMPIVSEETNAKFADAFVELIETIVNTTAE